MRDGSSKKYSEYGRSSRFLSSMRLVTAQRSIALSRFPRGAPRRRTSGCMGGVLVVAVPGNVPGEVADACVVGVELGSVYTTRVTGCRAGAETGDDDAEADAEAGTGARRSAASSAGGVET